MSRRQQMAEELAEALEAEGVVLPGVAGGALAIALEKGMRLKRIQVYGWEINPVTGKLQRSHYAIAY